MTDIDTAAVRASYAAVKPGDIGYPIIQLCDALDAARAELSDQERWTARANANTLEQRLRAEAAEKEARRLQHVEIGYATVRTDLHAAEARIAAALALVDTRPSYGPIRRALTGDRDG